MLEGVQRAAWEAAGLQLAGLQGDEHQALLLAPATKATTIAALVVHVQPCRSSSLLSNAMGKRIVRKAVEGAIAGAKAACPDVFACKAEERLEVALPALAQALAGIAVRMDGGDEDGMACALMERLWALALQC